MKRLLLLPIILFVLIACDEEKVHQEFSISEYWTEHHKTEWNSLTVTQNLLGTWDWVYNVCCPMLQGFKGEFTLDQNIQVIFSTDRITITQDGEVIESGDWYVETRDGKLFGVTASPFVAKIGGRILFNGDHVLFNSSYVDGPDNYFRKIPNSSN